MKICIIGAGAFGIAMCKLLEDNNDINLYTKYTEEKESLEKNRENIKLFKGVNFSNEVKVFDDLEKAILDVDIIVCAVPFKAIFSLCNELKEIYNNQVIVSVTKGIDDKTFKSANNILKEVLNTDKVCSLIGPSFAIDIVNKNNVSLMLAGNNIEVNKYVKSIFENEYLNLEITSDEIGVMVCSSIKNVIAIGVGILKGMKKSESTIAAYITNGLNDMKIIVDSLGGSIETVYSYAGVGDLILTSSSLKSRNCSFGYYLGEGKSVDESLSLLNGKTVEGISQLNSMYNYMNKNKLDLKIIPKLYEIINNGANIDEIL